MARILQIHAHYREPGGEDAVVEGERSLLEEGGHQIIPVRRENASGGLRVATQLASYIWTPFSTRAIQRVVEQAKPDVAHVHNTWFGIPPATLRALKRACVPTVATIHNYRLMCANAMLLRDNGPCELCVGSTPWSGVRYRCYRNSASASVVAAAGIQVHRSLGTWTGSIDQFLCPTEFLRDRLIAAGLPREAIAVHPNFVADPGHRAEPPSASRLVAYVGRLSEEKGLSVALEAWRRVAPQGLELAIAGDGPQREQLMREADKSVSFLGRLSRSEVNALLLSSRAVILPSICYEGQPLGVLEALAAGTAVLGSAIGGVGETIAPLGKEWRVTPGSVDDWASALGHLADDSFVDTGGRAARRTYEEHFKPQLARARLERIYTRLRSGQ
jgi:glycosyltransferase involved in cell wall biosynthesis